MHKRNLSPIFVAALGFLMIAGAPWSSWAASTLQTVKARGWLARAVADRVVFMDEGRIVEQSPPGRFFAAPQPERARLFLGRILHH